MTGFTYLLMSHGDPAGVASRVARIRDLSPTATVAVRWTRPGLLDATTLLHAGALPLPDDVRIRWGDWSLTRATLRALRTLREQVAPDVTVILSGQDHPVRDLAAWEREVTASGTDALLHADERDHSHRWRRCWHTLPEPALVVAGPLGRAAERLRLPVGIGRAGERTPVLHHARRAISPPVPYRKGSFWTTLSRDAVGALLAAADDPRLGGFFRTTLLPDEAFAHSVLAATPGLRTTAGRTSFTVFDRAADEHPRGLGPDDVAAARASGAPFARKVSGADGAFARTADAVVDAERDVRPPVPGRRPCGPASG
jgi:hypothetical protein